MLKKILTLSAVALLMWACSATKQSALKAPVEVSWAMEENMTGLDSIYYRTVFTIKNTSDKVLDSAWVLYYNQFPRVPLHEESTPIKVEKIIADFYRLYPTENFKSIAPGDSIKVVIHFRGASTKEVEAPVGFYFVPTDKDGKELAPLPVGPTKVSGFAHNAIQRNKRDELQFPSAQVNFANDKGLVFTQNLEDTDIFPSVKQVIKTDAQVTIPKKITITAAPELKSESVFFATQMSKEFSAELVKGGFDIKLEIDPTLSSINAEAYSLSITPEGVLIKGATPGAVFLATQTLRNIIGTSSLPKTTQSVEINDYPDFEYRGFMLDVARNFRSIETIKGIIDQMAYNKLNKFHFHFNDDEAWRLEIPSIPELVTFASRRGHTLDEAEHLHPSYGSGSNPNDPTSFGNGYYSREQFIDLIKYAKERHIDIIPEIETPGHARAAVYAMKSRYNKYKDSDLAQAEKFLLSDPKDTSTYTSAQGFHDNVMCVANEGVYNFLATVTDDLIAMYAEAGAPLYALQTGGDEVPRGSWLGSPNCQALVSNGTIAEIGGLRDYFTERFKKILDDRGLKFYGWMEIASKKGHANPKFKDAGFLAYCWDTVGEWGGIEVPYKLANEGVDVILCNAPNLYFDFGYSKHPKEPGLYWGGWVNERIAFDMLPFDAYHSVRMGMLGRPLDWDKDPIGKTSLTAEGRTRVKGIQGELWGEVYHTPEIVQYAIFPKIYGLAERAWNAEPYWAKARDKETVDVAYKAAMGNYLSKIAVKELPRLAKAGFNFRVAPCGMDIVEGMLIISNPVPGSTVHYTTDGSTPTDKSPVWTAPISVNGTNIKAVTYYQGKNSTVSEYIN